ncbi:MAG: penicillin-binding transpeptidase domain-containing protein, partial [Actinomycetota bacterium]|nr:penicillin-binding transpeptidase domain-containing protein [Actinomycetota bacterium]
LPVRIPTVPTADLRARLRRLASVLDTSATAIHHQIVRSLAVVPYSSVRLKTDVPRSVLGFITERADRFPGVTVNEVFLREYPRNTLAAQLLGTVGEVSPRQLHQQRYRGVRQGTIVGQEGLERTYDRYLRGEDGLQRVQVDAFGRPIPNDRLPDREPVAGRQLKLSLDVGLQATGERAMRGPLNGGGNPGGFVALDPRNGEVLALGSYPSFDPELLAKPITQKRYDAMFGDDAGAPRVNRAISGQYPTGSTFKPITALAALQSGIITPDTPIEDPGCIHVGIQEFCNAGKGGNGAIALRQAIQVSSDVFFYRLGQRANPLSGQVIQTWAHRLGLGRRTGIDLPDEFGGLIPDRQWRADIAADERRCRRRKHIALQANVFAAAAQGCGISDMRPWSVGDNIQLAVGQGDVQATPLQMAVAYSTIANGGKVVRPHLGLEIETAQGELLQRIEREGARRVHFSPANRQAIMDGLRAAAGSPGGTSADVFTDWPQDRFPVFGKTGTAERVGKGDQSWYVAYVPNATRPIVVAVTVEQGGFGAATAAPIARLLLSQWFGLQKKIVRGSSHTR